MSTFWAWAVFVPRKTGTALLYALFGIGSMVLAFVIVPIVSWLRGPGTDRQLLTQRIIHYAFRIFIGIGTVLGLFSLREARTDLLREDAGLVVANHPTLLDIVLLLSRMPQADCVVKSSAWANPFLRGIITAAGYIPNGEAKTVLDACAARLNAGRTLVLFPEASRSPEGGLGPFTRAAAHLALRTGCPIRPVRITCEPGALTKGQPWYHLPNRRLNFRLEVRERLYAKDLVSSDTPRPLAAREVTAQLRAQLGSG